MAQYNLEQRATDAVWKFFHLKKEYDQQQAQFDIDKKAFYEVMEEYFGQHGGVSAKFDDRGFAGGMLVVKKIEKTSVEWDASKLERKVDKFTAKQVIKKQYRITDIQGLIQYLKSCDVDPKIFRRFVLVDKTVDEKAVDRLGDLGQLTVQQISGCYTVKAHKPYFTITVKQNEDNEY